MYTIAETPSFIEDAKKLWTEEERAAFCVWLAGNPEAGIYAKAVRGNIPGHILKTVREAIENEESPPTH